MGDWEGQRLGLVSQNVVHGNKSVPAEGPRPQSVSVHPSSAGCQHSDSCWDLQVQFDQEVALKPTLEPHWSVEPFTALQTAFMVTGAEGMPFTVTTVKVVSKHNVS